MSFEEFVNTYDYPGAVVLLEGKREVAEDDAEKLTAFGRLLAARTKNMIFRSGNAAGADSLFCLGAGEQAKERIQVVVPYTGHRSKYNDGYQTFSADQVDYLAEPQIAYNARKVPETGKIIDRYISGVRDRASMKAAYLIRDAMKVTGTSEISPASFAIFYDDLNKPESGGTGFTMKICRENNVPFIDQRIWMGWGS